MATRVNPHVIAIRIAADAPRIDVAPLTPQAHASNPGRLVPSTRTPAGSGIPSNTPSGSNSATESRMRATRDNPIQAVKSDGNAHE